VNILNDIEKGKTIIEVIISLVESSLSKAQYNKSKKAEKFRIIRIPISTQPEALSRSHPKCKQPAQNLKEDYATTKLYCTKTYKFITNK
jgi:hypothetical protein